MPTKQTAAAPAPDVFPGATYDEFVPDKQARKECGDHTEMTIFRWEQDPTLGFPPKITIKGRNYRSRRALEEFKQRMIQIAISGKRPRKEVKSLQHRSKTPK